jgi:hypothetical protein
MAVVAVAGVLLVLGVRHFRQPPPAPRPPMPQLSAVAKERRMGPREPLPSEKPAAPKPVRRMTQGSLILHTVVPDHVGLTSAPLPSLFWHISDLPPPGSVAHLVLEDVITAERLVDIDLPPLEKPGLQRIDLWRYGKELPEFRSCRWSIALRIGGSLQPLAADAWIRRVNLPPEVVDGLRGAPTERFAAVYAESGLWYDALTLLVNDTEADTDDERAWAGLRALLQQAQLVLL